MPMLYELLPVVLFFAAFKYYDIYVATTVGIVATTVQVLLTRLFAHHWDRKQVITMVVFMVFGGMTLYFHDPIFVKWKPTIVFWIFSGALIVTQLFTSKSLIQRMMENALPEGHVLSSKVWRNLNLLWTVFFIMLGFLNLYVAYHFNNEAWVNFKLYGITSALLVISFIQAIYILRVSDKQT